MRRCVFESLLMLSLEERKARKVAFHPKATVIRGPNDTGKSCLMKTIYRTFSPIPPQIHPRWREAEVRSAMRFRLDGTLYTILNNRDRFSVFDHDGHPLITTSSVSNELAPFLADLFNFRLQLQSRTSEQTQATPAFLFLPFYVDQDFGWSKNWSSFTRLEQFTRWRRDTAEYHMGVRPNEFYQAKSGLARVRSNMNALHERRNVLQSVLRRLQEELARIDFDIDIESYQKEVESLLVFCNKLQKKEGELKRGMTRLYNTKAVTEAQRIVTVAAARELSRDYEFAAVKTVEDEVECPLCGTVHENSFADRFGIARDAGRCRELAIELQSDLSMLDHELDELKRGYCSNEAELAEARQLLNQRQGEITLRQVIEREGKKEAKLLIEHDVDDVNRQIGQIDAETRVLEERMQRYENKERRASIQESYANRMRRALTALDVVNLSQQQYASLDAPIPESGSDLPRALLAYYFSVLNTIREYGSAAFCPIVIDSPKQQDPDPDNWPRILNFIRDNQPSDSQLVLSLVDDGNVDFGGEVIDLNEKRSVLTGEQFDAVAAELMPLIEASEIE